VKIEYREGIKRLLYEYSDLLKEEIKDGSIWREKIECERLSKEDKECLLKDLCSQILVQGRSSRGVTTQIIDLEKTIQKWDIENFEGNLSNIGMSEKKKEKLRAIINYMKENSISSWIKELHKGGNSVPRMGPKSDDDFLKDHGFYEHVPIDRHTQRFLFRTGIIHWYLKKGVGSKEDILALFGINYEEKYKLFQRILVEFCKVFCDDVYAPSPKGELRLSENPGIIDIAIWRHCGEDIKHGCKNICGNIPKCDKCGFSETCLWKT